MVGGQVSKLGWGEVQTAERDSSAHKSIPRPQSGEMKNVVKDVCHIYDNLMLGLLHI